MAEELYYTSAERGLRPGTRGFSTVAYTRGMSPALIRLLESLSAYKGTYAVHDPRSATNPVACSHYRYTLVGKTVSIISRVGDSGKDHTNRSNKLAHHVVLSQRERPPGGPAWLATRKGFLENVWDRPPQVLEEPRNVPDGEYEGTFAATWEDVAGDAGWAGELAYSFVQRRSEPVFLVFEPGMPMLSLLSEATALLEPRLRWLVTFNTYFTALPAGLTCSWRCCVPDAYCLREAKRMRRARIIDLTNAEPLAEDHPLARCARDGTPLPDDISATGRDKSFVKMPNRNRKSLRMTPRPRGTEEGDAADDA